MANLLVIDGQGQVVYIKATGAGTSGDPFILERFGTVNILASALPDGASIETKQDDQITQLSALVATVDIDKFRTQIMDPIPAGTNKLGSIDVDAILAALPSGANNIGHVDVDTMPEVTVGSIEDINTLNTIVNALPTGANKLGSVDIDAIIAALPTGTNKLGSVDVDAIIAALPVGANKIGVVEVDNFPAQLDVIMDGGVGWAVQRSTVESATPTTPLMCTSLPGSLNYEIISDILISSAVDMRLTFSAEPISAEVLAVNIAANVPVQITPRSEIQLPVENQLRVFSDADGQLDITTWYREI